LLRRGQIVITYFHSNAHLDMTVNMLKTGIIGIAYEDVDDENNEFPMLSPMSTLAGMGGVHSCTIFFSISTWGKRKAT